MDEELSAGVASWNARDYLRDTARLPVPGLLPAMAGSPMRERVP